VSNNSNLRCLTYTVNEKNAVYVHMGITYTRNNTIL
jgi:hypothetical protein